MENEPTNSPALRLSDADRDAVVTRLNEAMSEGRISLGEFEERSRKAYQATVAADLVPLTADLPESVRTTPVRNINPPPQPQRRWAVSIMGGSERVGNWDPGDGVNSVTIMGGNLLDLTEVTAQDVMINAFTMMGATEIIVPRGATVDLGGFILMGGSSDETTATGDSTMRVRVRSFGLMGGCEVRHLSEKERAKRANR